MDRIEFEIRLSRRDVWGATIKKLCMSYIFRIYCFVVIVGTVLVLFTHLDTYGKSDYENLGMFVAIALLSPVAFFLGASSRGFKHPDVKKENIFMLDKEGFGAKFPSSEYRMKWNMVKSICETNNFIFMKLQLGPTVTIYKYLLPDETVSSVKKLLVNVPVQKKKLLTDEQETKDLSQERQSKQ